jgi:hypothetical protein
MERYIKFNRLGSLLYYVIVLEQKIYPYVFKQILNYLKQINKKQMDKIDKFFYINLSHRNDRKELIEKELQKLEIPQEKIFRFDAIKDSYGALGCAKSHFELVKNFLESNDEIWSIMEDDITFLTNREIIDIYVSDYLNDKNAHFFNGSVTFLQKSDYNKNLNRIRIGYCAAWYILKKEHSSIIFDSLKESTVGLSERKKFEEIDLKFGDLKIDGIFFAKRVS